MTRVSGSRNWCSNTYRLEYDVHVVNGAVVISIIALIDEWYHVGYTNRVAMFSVTAKDFEFAKNQAIATLKHGKLSAFKSCGHFARS